MVFRSGYDRSSAVEEPQRGCRTDRPAPPCLLDDTIQYEIDPLYVTVSDVLLLMT